MRAPAPLAEQRPDSLFVNGKANGFDVGPDGARRVRMREHDSMNPGSQHLLEHPRIRTNCRFVGAIHRHIDDHRRRTMAAPGRPPRHQSLHVRRQSNYVVGGVLHVIADIVGVSLGILLALFKTARRVPASARRPRMRAGVINRLAVRQQFNGPVDPLWLVGRVAVLGQHPHNPERQDKR